MKLKDIMTCNVEAIGPELTLQEAAKKMRSLDVGALPICQNDRLVGMITDRDITVRAVANGQNPSESCVTNAMSTGLIYCREEDDVNDAIKLMEEKQIRRLPVVDSDNRLVGIVSLGDIATRQRNQRVSAEMLQQVSTPNQPHV